MPDVIVNIVDATNLERNLYLTTQLIDMDIRLVMALNMYDELSNRKEDHHQMLGNLLGFPVVPTLGKVEKA
jgi:ferrous iron transport protein B